MYENDFFLDAGVYTCIIEDMEFKTDDKNRQIAVWNLTVTGGEHDGESFKKKYYLVSQKVADFLAKEMKMLGVEISNSQDFKAKRAETYGMLVKVQVTFNNQGEPAIYLKGVVSEKEPKPVKPAAFTW